MKEKKKKNIKMAKFPINMATPNSSCAWGWPRSGQEVAKGWPIILIKSTMHVFFHNWIRKNVNFGSKLRGSQGGKIDVKSG